MFKVLIGLLSMLSFAVIAAGALLLSVWNVKDDLRDLMKKKR